MVILFLMLVNNYEKYEQGVKYRVLGHQRARGVTSLFQLITEDA